MDFAQKFKLIRKKRELSQKQIAEMLGISNRAVSKWEKGSSFPTVENLSKLTDILNVSSDYFLSEEIDTDYLGETKKSGMQSIMTLYKIGSGPSSTHTIGTETACRKMLKAYPNADRFDIVLYNSLAKTCSSHGTDALIKKIFGEKTVNITLDYNAKRIKHPLTLDISAIENGKVIKNSRAISVGGGDIVFVGEEDQIEKNTYPHSTFSEITSYCAENNLTLYEYILKYEPKGFEKYLLKVWQTMRDCISRGLTETGILPGGLNIKRKAGYLYRQSHIDESSETKENRLVCAYAFAVSEENAAGSTVVTAPTCGAAGVVPAILYYSQQKNNLRDSDIIRALAVGGLIGNLIRTNASISGAECGCQAEIGSACAMAAAMLGELYSLRIDQIEYAAEIAIEHHLGLTCDPICGLVQIPCIERNAVAAMRAINAVNLANFLAETRKISLDNVINTMKETGYDMSGKYRETSEGGLAKIMLQ